MTATSNDKLTFVSGGAPISGQFTRTPKASSRSEAAKEGAVTRRLNAEENRRQKKMKSFIKARTALEDLSFDYKGTPTERKNLLATFSTSLQAALDNADNSTDILDAFRAAADAIKTTKSHDLVSTWSHRLEYSLPKLLCQKPNDVSFFLNWFASLTPTTLLTPTPSEEPWLTPDYKTAWLAQTLERSYTPPNAICKAREMLIKEILPQALEHSAAFARQAAILLIPVLARNENAKDIATFIPILQKMTTDKDAGVRKTAKAAFDEMEKKRQNELVSMNDEIAKIERAFCLRWGNNASANPTPTPR